MATMASERVGDGLAQDEDAEPDGLEDATAPNGALAALIARAQALGGGAAPVDRWDPEHCGTIPMRIAADGTWHYNGSPIARERLVQLFARILRREPDGSFVLVTPVEKMQIEVEDAPFAAVEIAASGEGEGRSIVLRTNVGDVVTLGPDHPLRVARERQTDGFVPYVKVRGGLEARLTRAAALELVDLAQEDADGRLAVWSEGSPHPLEPADD